MKFEDINKDKFKLKVTLRNSPNKTHIVKQKNLFKLVFSSLNTVLNLLTNLKNCNPIQFKYLIQVLNKIMQKYKKILKEYLKLRT